MILTALELADFRNYDHACLEFGRRKNFFIANNAQGKTNLLEGIYLLCLSKSFRTNYEKEAIRFSKPGFIIRGTFEPINQNVQQVIFQCSHDQGKQISINRKRLNKISELIGKFPVVLSSPDEYRLTIGPPSERRKFVDILLSQIYKKYFSYLQDYHRIIQQRNVILFHWKASGVKVIANIEPWDQKLIEIGSKIIQYRSKFSIQFSDSIKKIYAEVVTADEELTLNYQPDVNLANDNIESIEQKFAQKIHQTRGKEIQRGTSLTGPHRDDFVFKIGELELRKYGSRGQHKTVLISLVIAEYKLIKELTQETPIMLIDDLYSEIDQARETNILEQLNSMGQIFITSTATHGENKKSPDDKYFFIESGKIK